MSERLDTPEILPQIGDFERRVLLDGVRHCMEKEEWETMATRMEERYPGLSETFAKGQVSRELADGSEITTKLEDCATGKTLDSQAEWLRCVMGKEALEQLVTKGVEKMIKMPKGDVKEMSETDVKESVADFLTEGEKKGFKFETKGRSGGGKEVLYRIEALTSTTYLLLRLAALDSWEKAEHMLKEGGFEMIGLRLRKGMKRALNGAETAKKAEEIPGAVAYLARGSDQEIPFADRCKRWRQLEKDIPGVSTVAPIRHLPPGALTMVVDKLMA